MKTIFFTNTYEGEMLEIVKSLAPKGIRLVVAENGSQEECVEKVRDAEYLFAGHSIMVDETMLEAGKKLEMVQRFGVGLNSVDMDAMKKRGIPLYVNQGINAHSVSELTVLLMLALERQLIKLDAGVHNHEWDVNSIERHEIGNQIIGMIGFGKIGSLTRDMLRPFGSRVIYWKPHRLSEEEERAHDVEYRELDDLLAQADLVSLHCMLNKDNRYMMNKDLFSKMKDGAKFVNTSRGELVNEEDLADAILSGKLSGAALDVFCQEPLQDDSLLRSLPNVILTPHAGGVTKESFTRILSRAFGNIEKFDQGDLAAIEHCRVV